MKPMLTTLALSASITLVLLGGSSASAQEKKQENSSSETELIVIVKAGDTLSSIAEPHDVTYVDLYNANESIVAQTSLMLAMRYEYQTKKKSYLIAFLPTKQVWPKLLQFELLRLQ